MTEKEKKNLVEQKVAAFEKDYAVSSTAYRQALEAADTPEAIKAIDPKNYAYDNNKGNDEGVGEYRAGSSRYESHQNADGSYTAIGNNGDKITAKNFEELNDIVVSKLKDECLKKKEEPDLTFHSPSLEKQKIFASAAVLKHGVTIGRTSSIPRYREFWADLKKQYMADSKHNLSDWVKMTRFLPDELLSRTPEEMKLKDNMLKKDQIMRLRGIHNTSETPSLVQTTDEQKKPLSMDVLKKIRGQSASL